MLVLLIRLDLDPMAVIYRLDMAIPKIYLRIKIQVYRSPLSKITTLQTDACQRKHYHAAFTGNKIRHLD